MVHARRQLLLRTADAFTAGLARRARDAALAAVLLVTLVADCRIDTNRPAAALPLGTDADAVFAGPGAVAAWSFVVTRLTRKGAIRRAELIVLEERVTCRASADAIYADGVGLLTAVEIDLASLAGTAADKGCDLDTDACLTFKARAARLARRARAIATDTDAGRERA